MTAPRQIVPGTTYMITRRCAQRQLLLWPSEIINQIFNYCAWPATPGVPPRRSDRSELVLPPTAEVTRPPKSTRAEIRPPSGLGHGSVHFWFVLLRQGRRPAVASANEGDGGQAKSYLHQPTFGRNDDQGPTFVSEWHGFARLSSAADVAVP